MLPLPNRSPSPLWLAVRLPHLGLDLATRSLARQDVAIAISDLDGRRERIIDCTPAAARAGIRAGMAVTAALGIHGGLQVLPRNPEDENAALQGLAAWCYQYSSRVSLPRSETDRRSAMWLEVAGSERLFGSPAELGSRLERELGRLGYHARAGSAPTPEAAWLAAGKALHLPSAAAVRETLDTLPLHRLPLDPGPVRAMEQMGFRRLRELLRLPRKALTRRFGPQTADYLDHLLGTRPDPRPAWQPPETFERRLELPAEITAGPALLFPLKRLIEELCGVLRGGDTAVQSVDIALRHEARDDTRLQVGTQAPTQDPGRLLRLARERLERLRLPQPAREIRLVASQLLPLRAGQHTLFRDTPSERRQDIEQLAERLQARLGRDAVSGVTGVEDHRPEYSWRRRALDEQPDCTALAHRPAWLLQQPKRCDIARYQILAGPERIESGWWDGRDCRRDYFVVRDPAGSILWAFHEHKPHRGWYLHGVFG